MYLIEIDNGGEREIVFVEHLFDAIRCAKFFVHKRADKQVRVKVHYFIVSLA